MKSIGYTLVMIVLLVVAAFLVISPQKSEAPELTVDESLDVADVQSEETTMSDSYRYSLDTERSMLSWEARKKFVGEHIDRGTIAFSKGQIQTPENDERFYVDIVVDMNTIEVTETGIGGGFENLKGHLKSDDFFDVENHPEARLVTLGGNKEVAEGNLTIRGITAPVSVEISEWNEEEMYIMGSMIVNRTDFGIDFRKDGIAGVAKDQIIDENFTLNFKIYYSEN